MPSSNRLRDTILTDAPEFIMCVLNMLLRAACPSALLGLKLKLMRDCWFFSATYDCKLTVFQVWDIEFWGLACPWVSHATIQKPSYKNEHGYM